MLTYSVEQLPSFDAAFYNRVRAELSKVAELTVPPRDAKAFEVPAGHFFRIVSIEGPQVGDLNLWNSHDLTERFYSGKTRALHATHLCTGDRLWSTFPALRPMATITHASCTGKKLSIRSSSKVTSWGVPRVAIVVKSSSETSPLRKTIGNTGSAAGAYSNGRTPS